MGLTHTSTFLSSLGLKTLNSTLPNFHVETPSISLDDIDKSEATIIPKEHMYPLWREDITEVQTPLPFDIFIKINPGLIINYKGTSSLVDLINAEINIMELSKKPHPNICKYSGCIRDGDYVAGICFREYKCTLEDIIQGKVPVDYKLISICKCTAKCKLLSL